MMEKKLASLYNFRSYFFPLNGSFSNLLTRANNYRKIVGYFFLANNHWALSICMQKYAEKYSFHVLKVKKI